MSLAGVLLAVTAANLVLSRVAAYCNLNREGERIRSGELIAGRVGEYNVVATEDCIDRWSVQVPTDELSEFLKARDRYAWALKMRMV